MHTPQGKVKRSKKVPTSSIQRGKTKKLKGSSVAKERKQRALREFAFEVAAPVASVVVKKSVPMITGSISRRKRYEPAHDQALMSELSLTHDDGSWIEKLLPRKVQKPKDPPEAEPVAQSPPKKPKGGGGQQAII